MQSKAQQIVLPALILGTFALITTSMVVLTERATRPKIVANERQALLNSLYAVLNPAEFDNDLLADTLKVRNPELLGTQGAVMVYRARKQGKPIAVILIPIATDGYNGVIRLLVGIYYNGSISGVRVLSHRETPGLGDAIEADRSDWILSFNGRSLGNPNRSGWAVKRDGGIFDQFTGATITPRAVVRAVHKALLYFHDHRETLFAKRAKAESDQTP